TNFHREDTGTDLGSPPIFDAVRQRIFFTASADPFGQNPSEDCQIFSIDRNGADLQQLTFFHEAEHSQTGCVFDSRPRASATLVFGQDRRTGTVLLYSSCAPLGTNPNGGQIFAVEANGSGLRQLTAAQGFTFRPDRSSHAEIPSHWAYGPYGIRRSGGVRSGNGKYRRRFEPSGELRKPAFLVRFGVDGPTWAGI